MLFHRRHQRTIQLCIQRSIHTRHWPVHPYMYSYTSASWTREQHWSLYESIQSFTITTNRVLTGPAFGFTSSSKHHWLQRPYFDSPVLLSRRFRHDYIVDQVLWSWKGLKREYSFAWALHWCCFKMVWQTVHPQCYARLKESPTRKSCQKSDWTQQYRQRDKGRPSSATSVTLIKAPTLKT